MRLLAVWACALVTACGTGAKTTPPPAPPPLPPPAKRVEPRLPIEPPPSGRLADVVTPTGYRLHLNVVPTRNRFSGGVDIALKIARRTRTIWLHGRDLRIRRAELTPSDRWGPGANKPLTLKALPAIPPRGLIGFELPRAVGPGTAHLRIAFEGNARVRTGLFRQRYGNHWYAYTDLEPKDARRAFPCFDDPRFKVPWDISVTTPKGNLAFANTREVERTSAGNNGVRFRFARTKPLPSYLVALAVGPFEVVPAVGKSTVPLRIITLKGMSGRAAYAARHAPPLLAAAERYFDMVSPYPKIDLIAVPYFSGAMENPGLITVGAHILLLPDKPNADQRKMFAIVAAHEFAHLWLGDLVTMDYWNDLWLNEGFATWMADKLVAESVPRLGTRVEEVRNKVDSMMVARGPHGRAIRAQLTSRGRMDAAFDELTYKGAGALVTMFEARVGKARFQRVLRAYVRKHAHAVVSAKQLFAALTQVGASTEAEQLRRFVETRGLPLVSVEPRCRGRELQLTLDQKSYATLANPRKTTATWDIPVCLRFGHGKRAQRHCVRLNRPRTRVRLAVDRCPTWLMPNAGGTGYYHYRMPAAWTTRTARTPQLTERERADFAYNLGALLYANAISLPTLTAALRGVARSHNQHTLRAVMDSLATVGASVTGKRQTRRFQALVRQLLGRRARKLGLVPRATDDYDAKAIRAQLVAFVAAFGRDRRLLASASRRGRLWLRTGKGIEDDALSLILQLAGIAGDKRLFDTMDRSLVATKDPAERRALARGLGSFSQPALVARSHQLIRKHLVRGLEVLELLEAQLLHPAVRRTAYVAAARASAAARKRWAAALRLYLPLIFASGCSDQALAAFDAQFKDSSGLNSEGKRRFARVRARARQRIHECNTTQAALTNSAARYFR